MFSFSSRFDIQLSLLGNDFRVAVGTGHILVFCITIRHNIYWVLPHSTTLVTIQTLH